MRKLIIFIDILLTFFVAACNAPDPNSQGGSKSIFSQWKTAGSSAVYDFTSGSFNHSFSYIFLLAGGGMCGCSLIISGNEDSGVMTFSACSFNNLGSSATDPGCASINNNYTYTKSGSTINLCKGGTDCKVYY